MPATDLDLLVQATRDAGDIARGFFGADPTVWDKPDDAGPVTEADLAVDTHLKSVFLNARPDYGWLSEETEDTDHRLGTERQFILDPIDGTRAFINGNEDWGVSVAVAEQGEITAAVVYMPAKDMMFAAAKGQGATLNGTPMAVQTPASPAKVLTHKVTFDHHNWKDGQTPNIERHFRSSLAYRLCLVAMGRFDGMITLRPSWEWDIAAGTLIVNEAGGKVSDRTGQPLVYNNPHPKQNGVVAGHDDLHSEILRHLA